MIAPGQKVAWRTYSGCGPLHEGEVVCHVLENESLTDLLPGLQGLVRVGVHTALTRKSLSNRSTRPRYLIACRIETTDRRVLKVEYRCPSAAVVERQNPDARRET